LELGSFTLTQKILPKILILVLKTHQKILGKIF